MAEKGFQKQRAILRAVVNVSPINFFFNPDTLRHFGGEKIIAFKNIQKKNKERRTKWICPLGPTSF